MSNNLSRLEKIKLLQDIENGRKEIKEILPEEIQVWFEVGYDEDLIRLHNTATNEILTHTELQMKIKNEK